MVEAARGRPLHVHLSEQVAENDACLAAYGVHPDRSCSPTHGALGPRTTAVHATHLTDDDVALSARAAPTPASARPPSATSATASARPRACTHAGARLTLGSDSHAVVDLFEEMRAVELDERLATQQRGHWTAAELLAAGDRRPRQPRLRRRRPDRRRRARRPGHPRHRRRPRTAGTGADENTAVFAATAADVVHVVVDGRGRRHAGTTTSEIGRELDAAIGAGCGR